MIKKKIKIESYEVGPNGNVKLSALMKHMQQTALEDCDQYGASYENMREEDLVFVIIRFGIRFFRPIRKNDVIEILSVNDRIEGIVFVRDFLIYKDGVPAAEATTNWVMMSYSRRRPMRPTATKYPVPEMRMGVTSLELPHNICPDGVFDSSEKHTVRYSELDENEHLNNTVYADLVYDYSDCEIGDVENCFISFNSEALKDDVLVISRRKTEKGAEMKCVNERSGKVCFEGIINFR